MFTIVVTKLLLFSMAIIISVLCCTLFHVEFGFEQAELLPHAHIIVQTGKRSMHLTLLHARSGVQPQLISSRISTGSYGTIVCYLLPIYRQGLQH